MRMTVPLDEKVGISASQGVVGMTYLESLFYFLYKHATVGREAIDGEDSAISSGTVELV